MKFESKDILLSVLYLVVIGLCFSAALHYHHLSSLKLTLAWLAAGVISSQVVIDLGQFSSPAVKARLSATFRIAAAGITLLAAYFL